MRKSVLLLTTTVEDAASIGVPVVIERVPDLFTVAVHVSNFQGTVHIEASLANTPGDGDWFDVVNPLFFENDPLDLHPGITTATHRTFTGNFLWIRARMVAGDGTGEPLTPGSFGLVDSVLLNY